MREKGELREKINELESKLKDSRMFANLEKMNRKVEKKKLDEVNNNLKLRILQLEKEANMLECEKVNLRDTCLELSSKTCRLIEQIRELEEQKKKLLSLIAQGNENFERMISMGKEHGDMSGLGYNSNESTTYSTKNTFVKAKEKAHALPQVTQQQSNTYVGKTFLSSKEKGLENSLGQIPFQRQRNFEKGETSFSKGNTKDTHYRSIIEDLKCPMATNQPLPKETSIIMEEGMIGTIKTHLTKIETQSTRRKEREPVLHYICFHL